MLRKAAKNYEIYNDKIAGKEDVTNKRTQLINMVQDTAKQRQTYFSMICKNGR